MIEHQLEHPGLGGTVLLLHRAELLEEVEFNSVHGVLNVPPLREYPKLDIFVDIVFLETSNQFRRDRGNPEGYTQGRGRYRSGSPV